MKDCNTYHFSFFIPDDDIIVCQLRVVRLAGIFEAYIEDIGLLIVGKLHLVQRDAQQLRCQTHDFADIYCGQSRVLLSKM